jgi:predicted dehydrogenase
MKTAVVIGFGSIGQRHAKVLSSMSFDVILLTKRKGTSFRSFRDLETIFSKYSPNYIVVANETEKHHATLMKLKNLGFRGKVLCEKPLFAAEPAKGLMPLPFDCYIGYNLRFLETLQFLKIMLREEEVIMVDIRVGQHLSQWRGTQNFKNSYSARESGGGVIRDLSHELDYCYWLFGLPSGLSALTGKVKALGIESDEVWALQFLAGQSVICSLRLSYLDLPARRTICINTRVSTIDVDLLSQKIFIDGDLYKEFPDSVASTYLRMHESYLDGHLENLCSFDEGLAICNTIDMAYRIGKW